MSDYRVVNPATGAGRERVRDRDRRRDPAAPSSAATRRTAALGRTTLAERAAVLHRVADLYLERADELALLITREMGKTTAEAIGEIEYVADIYRYYADQGPTLLADERLDSDIRRHRADPQGADRARCSGSCRGTTPTTRSPGSPART